MFDRSRLEAGLPIRGLGKPLYLFSTIDSTNARALELGQTGAPHGTLVIADEQTAGRGRAGRRWLTPSRSAIALSLLLRWEPPVGGVSGALSGFGALSVAEAVEGLGAQVEIKWPNDVLVAGKKVAGVLVEAQWQGSLIASAVVGIGINVRPGSVPNPDQVGYPAGCLEQAIGRRIDREALILDVVQAAGRWLPLLGSPEMLEGWEARLAFRGMQVSVDDSGVRVRGRLENLHTDGRMVLLTDEGERLIIGPNAADLRPIDR